MHALENDAKPKDMKKLKQGLKKCPDVIMELWVSNSHPRCHNFYTAESA